ncbi:Calcium channel YVC1 [Colletotrichum sp. SAR11_59]|nr:Calcium channel YVC1 [Colletotrichum sp. SAR11_59]
MTTIGLFANYIARKPVPIGTITDAKRYQLTTTTPLQQPFVHGKCVLYDRDQLLQDKALPSFPVSALNCYGDAGCLRVQQDKPTFKSRTWNDTSVAPRMTYNLHYYDKKSHGGAMLIADSLARTSSHERAALILEETDTSMKWIDLKEQMGYESGIHRVEAQNNKTYPSLSYWNNYTDPMPLTLTVSEVAQEFRNTVQIDFETQRYGYGSGQSTKTLQFALVMMHIYLAVVGIYGFTIFSSHVTELMGQLMGRRRFHLRSVVGWGDLADLMLLALRSNPPDDVELNHVGAGVHNKERIRRLILASIAAPILLTRVAFTIMPDNIVFIAMHAMMKDFTLLTFISIWCFAGFLLALQWLIGSNAATSGVGDQASLTWYETCKWLIWTWFGLDGTGIDRSPDFHPILGPALMIAFAFLGNILFLTLLVALLSNTFSKIIADAPAEIQFRRAVITFAGVKSDSIFAYPPPFNLLALAVLLPLKSALTSRSFHNLNVTLIRALNAPALLLISALERRRVAHPRRARSQSLLHWNFSGFNPHGDIQAVFKAEPPPAVERELEEMDNLSDVGFAERGHVGVLGSVAA